MYIFIPWPPPVPGGYYDMLHHSRRNVTPTVSPRVRVAGTPVHSNLWRPQRCPLCRVDTGVETAKHVCQRQSTGFTGRQMLKQNRSVKRKTCAQNHSIIFHLPDCPDESRQTGREGFVLMSVLTPPFTTVPHRWPSVQSSTGQGCSPPPHPHPAPLPTQPL